MSKNTVFSFSITNTVRNLKKMGFTFWPHIVCICSFVATTTAVPLTAASFATNGFS